MGLAVVGGETGSEPVNIGLLHGSPAYVLFNPVISPVIFNLLCIHIRIQMEVLVFSFATHQLVL